MSKPRAYVGNFTLRLGPLSTQGRLLPVRRKLRSEFALCTPGADPLPVRQCYIDPNEKVWWESELGRAEKDKDGNLTPVDPAAIAAAKKSALALNYIDLTVHPAEDVDASLFPSDHNAYVFDPVIKNASGKIIDNPVNVAIHDVINVMVREHPDLAFVGLCNLSNHEGLFRIIMHKGHMALQRQLHPEALHEYEMDYPIVSDTDRAKGNRIVTSLVASYDDATYKDVVAERLATVASEEFDADAAAAKAAEPVKVDLGSILDAALAELG